MGGSWIVAEKEQRRPIRLLVRFHDGTNDDPIPLAAPGDDPIDERCRTTVESTSRCTSHCRLGTRKLIVISNLLIYEIIK